jgi:hypothetical protein
VGGEEVEPPVLKVIKALGGDRVWTVGLAVTAGVALGVLGPVSTADTASYVQLSLLRDPLSPLLLRVLQTLGGRGRLYAWVVLHTVLAVGATDCLARSFGLVLELKPTARHVLHLVALAPVLRFARELGSVSTALPLCLLWLATALVAIARRGERPPLRLLFLWQALGFLARTQLLLLAPFGLMVGVCTSERRLRWRAVAGWSLSLGLMVTAQGLYHAAASGVFGGVRSAGMQLLTTVVFVSGERDLVHVEAGTPRAFVTAVHRRVAELGLLASQTPVGVPRNHHFSRAYNDICWGAVLGQYARVVLGRDCRVGGIERLCEMTPDQWRDFDTFTMRVAWQVLPAVAGRFAGNILLCAYEMQKFYLLAVLILLGVGLSLTTKDPHVGWPLVLVTCLWAANLVLVSAVEYPMTKYTVYFDVPVICALAATLLSWREGRAGSV